MSTKKLIAEQIRYKIYGGYPDVNAPIQESDVVKAIEQNINAKYKAQYFNTTLPSGETIPNNTALMPYENVTVTSLNGKCSSTLPVMPVMLPRNMGVFGIRQSSSLLNIPQMGEFVPMLAGQAYLLNSDSLLNDLLFQVGYEIKGRKIVYKKDITLLGITTVDMDLIVMDISQFSDTDPLPITPDMKQDIINEVLAMFAPVVPESGKVNPYSNINQQPQK